MQRVTAAQNEALDLLVWRHLGSTTGAVEQTLELNPHLAQYGPVLPHGTEVLLPDTNQRAPATQDLIQLWD